MTVSVSPTTTRPTHHISLTDGNTTIGLILCDTRGVPSQLGIRQGGIPRTALKTQVGNTGYADFEMPYSPIAQVDWSGGRAGENHEDDATRYNDGTGVDTTRGDIILGPLATVSGTLTGTGRTSIIYFEYKNQLYAVCKKYRASGMLMMNGYRGLAAGIGTSGTFETGITLTANVLAGCIVKVIAGPGATEETTWRKIVSNTTGGVLTVDIAWDEAHTTGTEYVILGTDVWTEVTGHGFTGNITDVLVVDAIVYFAQGESIAIIRMYEYNKTGVWTREFAADSTNTASYLKCSEERYVWKAMSTACTVGMAPVSVGWGTNLVFAADVTCGNKNSKITGLLIYGDQLLPYILKEDSIGYISDSIYYPLPIPEMKAVSDDRNGRAALHHGVYLYSSLLDGLERYYDTKLDDMGPNRDEGLPEERQGAITHLVGYPGRFYVVVDAGGEQHNSVYDSSSILCWNSMGWHEIWRGSNGQITSLYIQVIPGDTPDRLWTTLYTVSSDYTKFYRLPLVVDPRRNTSYAYASSGSIESCWMHAGLKDVQKFWKSVSLFSENLSSGSVGCHIHLAYQVDTTSGSGTWTNVSTPFTVSPQQEVDLSSTNSVSGRKLKYKLTMETGTSTTTPRVTAVVVNTVTRIPTKKSWTVNFLAEDAIFNLCGTADTLTADALLTQLDTWANGALTPLPLTLHSNYDVFDDKLVFIDPASVQPLQMDLELREPQRKAKLIASLTLFEA